jgi:hypothetical protein
LFQEKPIHIREQLDDGLLLFITFTTYPGTMLPSMDSILSMNTVHWRLAVVLLEQVADPSPLLGRAYSDEVLDELRRGAGEERLPSAVYLSVFFRKLDILLQLEMAWSVRVGNIL